MNKQLFFRVYFYTISKEISKKKEEKKMTCNHFRTIYKDGFLVCQNCGICLDEDLRNDFNLNIRFLNKSDEILKDHNPISAPLRTDIGTVQERFGKFHKLNKINKTCDRDRIKRKQDESKAIFFKFKSVLPSYIFDDACKIFSKINILKLRGRYSALEHQVLISIKISLERFNLNNTEIFTRIEDLTDYSINEFIFEKVLDKFKTIQTNPGTFNQLKGRVPVKKVVCSNST